MWHCVVMRVKEVDDLVTVVDEVVSRLAIHMHFSELGHMKGI